jgi:hypothetical protein
MFARYNTPAHKQAGKVDVIDLVGEDNDAYIGNQARIVRKSGGTVVAAWGDDGWSRHGRVLSLLRQHGGDVWCFGTSENPGRTSSGFPNHPAQRGAVGRSAEAVVLKRY